MSWIVWKMIKYRYLNILARSIPLFLKYKYDYCLRKSSGAVRCTLGASARRRYVAQAWAAWAFSANIDSGAILKLTCSQKPGPHRYCHLSMPVHRKNTSSSNKYLFRRFRFATDILFPNNLIQYQVLRKYGFDVDFLLPNNLIQYWVLSQRIRLKILIPPCQTRIHTKPLKPNRISLNTNKLFRNLRRRAAVGGGAPKTYEKALLLL